MPLLEKHNGESLFCLIHSVILKEREGGGGVLRETIPIETALGGSCTDPDEAAVVPYKNRRCVGRGGGVDPT